MTSDPYRYLPPPLVSRDPEVEAVFEALLRGARACWVCGPAGFGKSDILTTVAGFYTKHRVPFAYMKGTGNTRKAVADFFLDAAAGHDARNARATSPFLMALDEYDGMAPRERRGLLAALLRATADLPHVTWLIGCRTLPRHLVSAANDFVLELGLLRRDDVHHLARAYGIADEALARLGDALLYPPVAGAVFITLAGGGEVPWLSDRSVTGTDLIATFTGRPVHGLLGPDGRPLVGADGKSLPLHVTSVGTDIIRSLAEAPDGLHQLSPRRFEEVVAELFGRNGYDVELTAETHDGGVDVFAARKDMAGSFLYAVECKRYRPERRVSVNVLRELTGTVQAMQSTAGVVVTTSSFTSAAKRWHEDHAQYRLGLRGFVDLQQWLRAAP